MSTPRRRRAATLLVAGAALAAAGCTDAPSPMADRSPGAVPAPEADQVTDVHADHQGHAPLGEPAGAPAPTRHTGPQGGVGQFIAECDHSHSAPDDPIVYPDEPGRSHLHDFFGNTSTDASSDLESLLAGDTTCSKPLDTASYWAPALLEDGEPVTPSGSVAYYRAAPGVEPTDLVPYPPGLRIVAGDLTATAEDPQPVDLAGWACGVSSRQYSAPPDCPATAPLRAVITFPDCWDGINVDHADHRAHMANSAEGECPSSHPVHVPQLTFAISYPISGADRDLSLASGGPEGLHSDFFNAWDAEGLRNEIETCLHRDAVCGVSSNRGQEPLFTGA